MMEIKPTGKRICLECKKLALPYSNFCVNHYNPKQFNDKEKETQKLS